jgi:hypothetical protein
MASHWLARVIFKGQSARGKVQKAKDNEKSLL